MGDNVKIIFKFIKRFIMGGFLLYAYNLIASSFNISIPINLFTLVIVSIFDVFGITGLVIIKMIGL